MLRTVYFLCYTINPTNKLLKIKVKVNLQLVFPININPPNKAVHNHFLLCKFNLFVKLCPRDKLIKVVLSTSSRVSTKPVTAFSISSSGICSNSGSAIKSSSASSSKESKLSNFRLNPYCLRRKSVLNGFL